MERIGLAASRMAKGSLVWYNIYVVIISFLFSLFIFLVAGSSVMFSLIIIHYIGSEVMSVDFFKDWSTVLTVCLVGLSVLMGLFNLIAISKNMKIHKPKE